LILSEIDNTKVKAKITFVLGFISKYGIPKGKKININNSISDT
jgi:hypothetical protein